MMRVKKYLNLHCLQECETKKSSEVYWENFNGNCITKKLYLGNRYKKTFLTFKLNWTFIGYNTNSNGLVD